jgi:capsular exopolysaccharide synthesis family protein
MALKSVTPSLYWEKYRTLTHSIWGDIPIMANKFFGKKKALDAKAKRGNSKLSADSSFQVTEAYKILRTNLLFALAATQNKSIIISSAMPSEGKSATCSNLAITMAQTGANVILIDADLRKPTQHQIFHRNNKQGLTTILAGFDEVAETITKGVEPHLDLVTSGPVPPNPSELLGTDRMAYLINILNEHYDYIFIDTPPINVVTDAMVLAGNAAGVVLVTRQKQSTYDELTKAVSSIEFAGARILGLVINGVNEKSGRYGKYKYGKYKYSYGGK